MFRLVDLHSKYHVITLLYLITHKIILKCSATDCTGTDQSFCSCTAFLGPHDCNTYIYSGIRSVSGTSPADLHGMQLSDQCNKPIDPVQKYVCHMQTQLTHNSWYQKHKSQYRHACNLQLCVTLSFWEKCNQKVCSWLGIQPDNDAWCV